MNNKNVNEFKRVSKTVAKRLYNEGLTLYVVACKVRPDFEGYWITPYEMNKSKLQGMEFEKEVNSFEFFNCNSELGNYSAYYII